MSPRKTREDTPTNLELDRSEHHLKDKPTIIDFQREENEKGVAEDPQIELLRQKQLRLLIIHEKLGHISFSILKLLAKCSIISRNLEKVPPPMCPGCAYRKAHRKRWRDKGTKSLRHLRKANQAGEVVSVDQLISTVPGFVPIHRGKPTLKQYVGATVFVDHFTDFAYVHLMTELNAESTVKAKQAFERLSRSYNIKVRHYHADNGLFDTKALKTSVEKSSQTISFCGVNAHHQNGKAENRIKDISVGARAALLHAAHRWPKAVNAALWPAALKNYVNIRKSIPTRFIPEKIDYKDRRKKSRSTFDSSPFSKFSGVETPMDIKNLHPFGCPVYVLGEKLQANKSVGKWNNRSRVSIFLCHSPLHSNDVPLVLNTQTGNVSPSFTAYMMTNL